MKRLRLLLLCVMLAGATGAAAQPAQVRDDKAAADLEQATRIVKEKDNSRVLSAETREENGKEVYKVKVLDAEGRVRTVKVPAKEK
ncbi:MAG TPA: hypothetical protein VJN91_03405 [Gammaproteobacteria bacterium]|nr:hypothetical protein [Gammaproteobacteria bacterium]